MAEVGGQQGESPVNVEAVAVLPLLATWLGHCEPSDTYWYLTGTAELLAAATDRVARRHGDRSEERS